MKNREIIEKLLEVKNILNEAGRKEIFFEFGLTVANYEILKIIEKGEVKTITDLKNIFSESLASLTQKTQKLEELKYLKKEKDENDPRKNILIITKKGIDSLRRVEKKIDLVSSFILKKFSQKEKENFYEILDFLSIKLKNRINKKIVWKN